MTQLLWNGLFVGSFYALIALGYSMVYGIIKLLNFAHGDLYMLGAFIGYAMLSSVGIIPASMSITALLIVLLLTMIISGGIGVGIERLAYRPLRGSPRLAVLITAVGASFTLEYGVSAIAGPNPGFSQSGFRARPSISSGRGYRPRKLFSWLSPCCSC
ncbi:hypothetical protein NHF46_04390 [Arthrobacter alpinus]|nr:hypothetical protein [Arthrobacter alpinus]